MTNGGTQRQTELDHNPRCLSDQLLQVCVEGRKEARIDSRMVCLAANNRSQHQGGAVYEHHVHNRKPSVDPRFSGWPADASGLQAGLLGRSA